MSAAPDLFNPPPIKLDVELGCDKSHARGVSHRETLVRPRRDAGRRPHKSVIRRVSTERRPRGSRRGTEWKNLLINNGGKSGNGGEAVTVSEAGVDVTCFAVFQGE